MEWVQGVHGVHEPSRLMLRMRAALERRLSEDAVVAELLMQPDLARVVLTTSMPFRVRFQAAMPPEAPLPMMMTG
jgi:hypothetical protein